MQFLNPNEVKYYFGRLLPSEAEIILTRAGKADGLFLLRDKRNSIGSYALSVCFEMSIKHFAIIRQDDERVKIEGGNSFYGPIEVINNFINNADNHSCKPSFEFLRPKNTKPIGYLFISSENYNEALEQINRSRIENITDGWLAYKYEKLVLSEIHFSQKWCLKDTNSKEAEKSFSSNGYEDGKFLLRYKKFLTNFKYKLSVCLKNKIYHYKINYEEQKYFLEKETYDPERETKFFYLAQLIDFYGREQGCLPTKLKLPFYVKSKNNPYYCDTNQNYETIMLDTQLKIVRRIASGPISNVYEAQYKKPEARKIISIAIKFLKNNYNEDILNKLKPHPHILSTLKVADNLNIILSNSSKSKVIFGGLSQSNILEIIRYFENDQNFNIEKFRSISFNVTEYSSLGTLNDYVKRNKSEIDKIEIFQYVQQILSGLEFIAENNIVHRNVSARNVLLFEKKIVKICGFGLAKYINQSTNDVRIIEKYLPYKWFPPEAFDKIFTEKTDVYSFGVLLWELFSKGSLPYENIPTNTEESLRYFIKNLKSGDHKLDKPDVCPDYIYKLMCQCWHINPVQRPTFKELNSQYQEYLIEDSRF